MGTFDAEYLILDTLHWMMVFSVFLKTNFQAQFSLLLSAVAVYKQEITILRKVLTLCNYRLYVN